MSNQMNNVEKYSVLLCDALYMSMKSWTLRLHENAIAKGVEVDYHIRKIDEIKDNGVDQEYYLESGRKYYKLIYKDGNSRSVHCFIDKKTGSVYKSSSWKSPAKGERYNLLDDNSRELCYKNCDAFGGYLYAR
jgi:hypothetical protein